MGKNIFEASPLVFGRGGERRTVRFGTTREKGHFLLVAAKLRKLADERRAPPTPIERFVFKSAEQAAVAFRHREDLEAVAGLASLERCELLVNRRPTARAVPLPAPAA